MARDHRIYVYGNHLNHSADRYVGSAHASHAGRQGGYDDEAYHNHVDTDDNHDDDHNHDDANHNYDDANDDHDHTDH